VNKILLVLPPANLGNAQLSESDLGYAHGIISCLAKISNLTILLTSDVDVKKYETILSNRSGSILRVVALPEANRSGSKSQDLRLNDYRPFVNRSVIIYDYLLQSDFDCAIFDIFDAPGFVPIRAKRTGIGFENVLLISWLRTCHKFQRDQLFDTPLKLRQLGLDQELDFVERYCCEKSDLVISHTGAILEWALREKWKIDARKVIDRNDCATVVSNKRLRDRVSVKNLEEVEECLGLAPNPLVSICVAHFNDGLNLCHLLRSIEESDYENFEVVIVDDGSTDSESLNMLESLEAKYQSDSWRFIFKEENESIGPTRNLAVSLSRGQLIIFMDSDNLATKGMISDFVRGMLISGADCLTCSMIQFTGEGGNPSGPSLIGYWMPLGGCVEAGLYSNIFGDANFCVKKSTFEMLGGFCGARGEVADDWEFLARLVLSGFSLDVIPKGIFLYRVRQGSWLQSAWSNHSIETLRKRILASVGPQHGDLVNNLLLRTIAENKRLRSATWKLDRRIVRIALQLSEIVSEDQRVFIRDFVMRLFEKTERIKLSGLTFFNSKKKLISDYRWCGPWKKWLGAGSISNLSERDIDGLRFFVRDFSDLQLEEKLRRLGLPLGRPIFGFIGNLTHQSGPLGFLRLAFWMQMFKDDSFFVMLGEGNLEEEVQNTAKKYKLENIQFFNFLEKPEELYALLSGLVVTACSGCEPKEIYEALASGVPVFSTEVGAAKHLLEQYGSGLAVPHDPAGKDFADCWKLWKDNLEIYKTAAVETADLIVTTQAAKNQ
jgi:glycosyltransferase involved in cell wall biosynthesis